VSANGGLVSTFRGSRGTVNGIMAKRRVLLVDGHSVIFSLADLRAIHEEAPRRAREGLCERLTRYADQTGEAVVLVFDGSGAELNSERAPHGIQIIYSPRGGAADDVIERLVGKYAGEFEITVVTRDYGERVTVEAFGAETMEPEMLARSLEAVDAAFHGESKKYFRDEGS
jgi:predicted RNA-binding protein with PIN domain